MSDYGPSATPDERSAVAPREHDRVRLTRALPQLAAGLVGTVVHVYRGGAVAAVEFGECGHATVHLADLALADLMVVTE